MLDVEDGLEELDKEVLYTPTNWSKPRIRDRLKKARKCEILVPTAVPNSLIVTMRSIK